jgi:hypothetical protein
MSDCYLYLSQGSDVAGCACHSLPARSGTLGSRLYEEKMMRKRIHSKLIHEGQYVAEVDVELIETDESWSPYLSIEDAYRLDDVRDSLRRGDIRAATRQARVFSLIPVAV